MSYPKSHRPPVAAVRVGGRGMDDARQVARFGGVVAATRVRSSLGIVLGRNDVLRVGIIGFGFMGRMHFRCWRALAGATVTAVCDADPHALDEAAKDRGNIAGAEGDVDLTGVKIYNDVDELLRQERLDAVSITVPTHLHPQTAIAALEAGWHVLCEKPMALNLAEGARMIEAAKRTGKILQIGHCIRFWPEYAKAREIAPYSYYRGLADRPDILEIIARHGMSYVRSYGRNGRDYFPLDWDVQPFWYERQGFPDLLETPMQGWIDAQWRRARGWRNWAAYHEYLKEQVDRVAAGGLCWSHCQHDWTSVLYDEPLSWTRKLLEYAAERLEIRTHFEYRQRLKHPRQESTPQTNPGAPTDAPANR